MGINKLTALDTEKQEAKRNYNTAKADYEREYRGFPFKGLHVRCRTELYGHERYCCCFPVFVDIFRRRRRTSQTSGER